MLNREAVKEKLAIFCIAMNSTIVSMVAQQLQKACDALTKYCSLGPLRVVIKAYIWFNIAAIAYQVVSHPADSLVSL